MNTTAADVVVFDAKLINEKEYWIERLSGWVEESNLPTSIDRPQIYMAEKALAKVRIPEDLSRELVELAGNSPFLIYTILLASVKICLWRYTGRRNITVGSPALQGAQASNRRANVLAIRDEMEAQRTFRQFLMQVRKTLLAAYENQHYPFKRLIKDLEAHRTEYRCPLFDVVVAIKEIHSDVPAIKNDLTMIFGGAPDKLGGVIEYNPTVLSREDIARFRAHFLIVLEQALAETNTLLRDFDMLTERERHQLLAEWSEIRSAFQGRGCIHWMFERQVEKTPEAMALTYEGENLTYSELNARANQLAHYLRAYGVGPDVLVGICAERSVDMVVGLLGVLKAGGAYVPLDPSHPKELLAYMIEDAQVSVILTQRQVATEFPNSGSHLIYLDTDWQAVSRESEENPDTGVTADNLAYMIYTSGSTGRRKGVLVEHRGVCNLAEAQIRAFGVSPSSQVLQFASFSFDASVSEIAMALLAGATLRLEKRESLLPGPELLALLRDEGITTVTFPPSILAALPFDELPALETIVVAGEPCSADLAAQWGRGRRFLNAYGPTETTVCATIAECAGKERSLPIGRPMANAQVYLLNPFLQAAPIGVSGELHIGGPGLARGYRNHPELTAEKFIPNPFSQQSGGRLYKSGDLARYLPDGNTEFLGRLDHQVKVRGYRIEPGEIEAALKLHPGVRAAVVTALGGTGGENRLVAYLEARLAPAPSTGELRQFLKDKIPEHMTPSAFVVLEALPLNSSGKVDRRALPAPDQARPDLGEVYAAPRTPIEETVATIWAEVFKLERVGIHDNFFNLGGHSLFATQVMSRVRKVFQLDLPLRSLFEAPTVAGLAAIIVQRQIEQAVASDTAAVLKELEELSDEEVKSLLVGEMH